MLWLLLEQRFIELALGRRHDGGWLGAALLVLGDASDPPCFPTQRTVAADESRCGHRGRVTGHLRELIATMTTANRTWGDERIAAELLLKLGIRISPRTVRRYMPSRPTRRTTGTQAWSTFIRNHAGVLACDFFVTVAATFLVLHVFVVVEIGTRRILHCNVTAHPTAAWTVQQLLDRTLAAIGLAVLKTPCARRPRMHFVNDWRARCGASA